MKHIKPNTKFDLKNELTHFERVVFGEFYHNQKPVWAETVQREKHWQQDPTHDSPTIKKVEYSDGFGRILQTRAQAEDVIFGSTEQQRRTGNSGLPADQDAQNQPAIARKKGVAEADNVVVSGWKVYNNKGKVVEEYEPFFDKGYGYKTSETYTSSLAKMSIKYDAGDRPTETEFPDGSKSLIVYGTPDSIVNPPLASNNKNAFTPSPWERFTYDQNDLEPLTGGSSASTGAFTPKSETVDALGRTIKTMEHDSQPTSNPNVFEDVVMHYEYDVRGNLIKVTDPLNRTAFTYHYDLRPPEENEEGEKEPLPPLKTNHIDSGASTIIYDTTGKPIQSKDAKDAESLSSYDRLQRPLYGWSKNNLSDSLRMTLYNVYGEQASNPVDHNLMGKLWEQYDEAGKVEFVDYDFKENLLIKSRRTIRDNELKTALDNYEAYLVDWTSLPNILISSFRSFFEYDALDRVTEMTLPQNVNTESKTIVPEYNRAGALEKVSYDGNEFVQHIAYNAKGQRLLMAFGNSIMTRYTYDNQTFRLKRQRSEQFTYSEQGVNITYNYQSGTVREDNALAYDLVGNILQINDRTPECGVGGTDSLDKHYTYDPLYRLTSATGRENVPGTSYPFPGWEDMTRGTDSNTTTAYTRKYSYDRLGNINELKQLGNITFNRIYDYPQNSAGERTNNKLESVTIGSDSYQYTYDATGNQLTENTNRKFEWDAGNRLQLFKNQAGTGEPSIMAQYLYDNEGNRVKKIVRKQGGNYEIRTYIDGVFEYFTDEVEEQNTVHIMDDESRIATVRIGDDMGDSTPAIKFILENNIGSSTALLDDRGALINRQEYYPFGETSFGSYTKKRYQYTGKERDEESGLYYYGARYYSAWTCRFISVDPLAHEYANLTSYNNASNNPITSLDIDGMQNLDEGGSEVSGETENTSDQDFNEGEQGEDPASKTNLDMGAGDGVKANMKLVEKLDYEQKTKSEVKEAFVKYFKENTDLSEEEIDEQTIKDNIEVELDYEVVEKEVFSADGSSKTKTEYKLKSATVTLKGEQLSFGSGNGGQLANKAGAAAGKKGFELVLKAGLGSPKAKAARYTFEYIFMSGELGKGSTLPKIDWSPPVDHEQVKTEVMTRFKLSEFFQGRNFKVESK